MIAYRSLLGVVVCAAAVFAGVPVQAASGPKWSGYYVGAGVGLAGVHATETDTTTPPGSQDVYSGGPGWGAAGTLTWGYNFKLSPSLLIGTISALDLTNATASLTSPGNDANSLRENFAYSSGARAGILPNQNTLIYADGGYSRAGFTFSYNPPGGPAYSNGHIFTGWFAGGGVEEKVTDALSLSFDYRFARYGSETDGATVSAPPPPPAPAPPIETHDIQPDVQTIRLGLVYNFGG